MTRVGAGALLMIAATLGATLVPESFAARNKDKAGLFGTINGMKFTATNVQGADDPCVNGIYQPGTGTLVFGAIECRRKRRRQGVAVKRNYQVLVLACAKYDPNASIVPPYEIPCPGSGYTEAKTGRFGLPISMAMWTANFEYLENFVITSNVRIRIDAFDGTSVRGAIFGVFDVPGQGASGTAPIEGELQFNFPVRIQ